MLLRSLVNELPKPSVILVGGRRGSGKDVTAHQVAREIHWRTKKPIYIDLEPSKYNLPNYFVQSDKSFANGSIYLLSDAHLSLYAREWGTDFNKSVDKLITLSRQKDIDIIMTTQETSRLDKNVVTAVDCLIFKEPSLLAAEFERPEIRKLVEQANEVFKDKGQREKWRTAFAVTPSGTHTIYRIDAPFYWSDELSKRYGQLDYEKEEKQSMVIKIKKAA